MESNQSCFFLSVFTMVFVSYLLILSSVTSVLSVVKLIQGGFYAV
jgi:hypothetical protein